jgi:hypothetical protein
MATENLMMRDARLAHFHDLKILAQVLPRLPPELDFGAPRQLNIKLFSFLPLNSE